MIAAQPPRKRRLSPQQQRWAYHEAAHAVAAHVVGYQVEHIIMSNLPAKTLAYNARGQVQFYGAFANVEMRGYYDDDRLFVALAPDGAERRLCLERGWLLDRFGLSWMVSDAYEAMQYFMERTPPGTQRLPDEDNARITRALARSAQFVEEPAHWRAIVAVAEAILAFIRRDEFAYLSGDEVHALIRAAMEERHD
jgi:hypothetical protein